MLSKYYVRMPGNLERFSGIAQDYHAVRPEPPAALKTLLTALSATAHPKLIVDIGSGTGLSTRYWADTAARVVGVEPNDDMRALAASATNESNVEFIKGLSTAIQLPSGQADIVTCSQALHWMEPEATFSEVARVLRPGGVFAAYDYDWPPTTGVWEADQAYIECMNGLESLEAKETEKDSVHRWSKAGHLGRMRKSGQFRFAKEIVLHHVETGDADRFIGLLMSQAGIRLLLSSGFSERDLGIDTFRARCRESLGLSEREWYWSSRVRFGIK